MGPPAPVNRLSRPSVAPKIGSGSSTGSKAPPANRLSLAQRAGSYNHLTQRLGSGQSQAGSAHGSEQAEEDDSVLSAPVLSPPVSRHSAADRRSPESPVATRNASANAPRTGAPPAAGNPALQRKIEDLETKLRLMEKKRAEDRERLKELDHISTERDKFESIIKKLQSKLQPQVAELSDLRQQLKTAQARVEEVEAAQADHEHILENATMDQLIAEEQAEVLKYELEALKAKAEELELEVEVLREENNELGGEMSAEDKASQGWIAMERNNERLKDALWRLRELTQETEEELKEKVKMLEEDLEELSGVKEQFDEAKAKLEQNEVTIEDLRQQLDNALGAEDMIEELTERNMSQSEQLEELRAVISDLEALKELNDELEINHVETEKEMQADLDFKDTVISDFARRVAEQQDHVSDLEDMLVKYRGLVGVLQTDLEEMRVSHAVTETEAEKLNSSSRAMAELNMKLQLSAQKTQVKTIELELRRLEAQEAAEHLNIVQMFLPEGYQSEKSSVLALLRFKRVAFKANLVHTFVKERVANPQKEHEDDLFVACDVLDKLAYVTAMCERFASAMSACGIESWRAYAQAGYDLEPVERALNTWIEGLRRDELREKAMSEDLRRTVNLLDSLAENRFGSENAEEVEGAKMLFADEVYMRALVMQSHLENSAAALAAAKAMVQAAVPEGGDEDELAQHFARKTDAVINATRSAKVIVSKAVRSLEDLKTRSLALSPETLQQFETAEEGTAELALFTRQTGLDLFTLLSQDTSSDNEDSEPATPTKSKSHTYTEISASIHLTTSSLFSTSESSLFATYTTKLRHLTSLLSDLADLASDLNGTTEFERPPHPWVLTAKLLASKSVRPVEFEDEIRRLREENMERMRMVALRDQSLEESAVKIELLEARTKDAGKMKEKIAHLENKLEAAGKKEVEMRAELEAQIADLEALEVEKERYRKIAAESQQARFLSTASSEAGNAPVERAVATARELAVLQTEIAALQASVRFLREEARRAKLSTAEIGNLAWLSEPLVALKPVEQKQRESVVAEGSDVLSELLNLTSSAKLVKLGERKRGWRPVRETPGWHVARQREEFETLKGWEKEVVSKAKEVAAPRRLKTGRLAEVSLRLPRMEKLGVSGQEVRIVQPEERNGFRRGWGVV